MSCYFEQRIKVRHLRVIEALDRYKSLLRAARSLNVTQPALTRTLQEIEDIVGAPIFERHARGVRPNAVGEVMVEAAHAVLGQLRRVQDTLEGLAQDNARTINIGALPVAASGLMPGVLAALYQDAPDLRIRLIQGRMDELAPKLASGEIDMIIGRLYTPGHDDGFTRLPLYSEPMSLIARVNHPVFSARGINLEQVGRHRWVLPTLTQHVEADISRAMESLKVSPPDYLRSSSAGFIRELLLSTDTITVMPAMLLVGDIQRGKLQARAIQTAGEAREGGIIFNDPSLLEKPDASLLLRELNAQIELLARQSIVSMRPVFLYDKVANG